MNKRLGRWWNVALLILGFTGVIFCAIAFAKAVDTFTVAKCVIYFILTSLCLETFVFSAINLLKKRK